MGLIKKAIAEVIGTAVLTFAACGVAVAATGHDGWWVATSLAFGLVIVAMAYSIGRISGCHINPAVSLGCLITKRMTIKEFLVYVAAQVVGAFVGSVLLALCLRGDFSALGGNAIQSGLMNSSGKLDAWSYIGAFLAEVVLTGIFVYVILNVTDDSATDGSEFKKGFAGVIIGATLTLVHLLGLGITGTSVNPARSLAPAVLQAIAGDTTSLSQIWIWILAPLAGAALAAIIYMVLHKNDKNEAAE